MTGARPSLAPIIAATVIAAIGSQSLVAPECWPSSDLDGHIATIDLYRDALGHGVLWPYDRGAALGHDAVPGYAWPFELLLGAFSALAAACGAVDASRLIAVAVIIASAASLPLACAWATARLTGGDRPLASHAGALAGVAFLAVPNADLATGHGLSALTGMGMVNQGVGWCLLALLAGRSAAITEDVEARRWRPDPWLALIWAALLSVHSLSAIAGGVVLAVAAWRRPRLIAMTLALGIGCAAMAVSAIIVTGDRQLSAPWFLQRTGTDAFLALAGPLLIDRDWRQGSAAALQVGVGCVALAAVASVRRIATPAVVVVVVAALALTVVAALPVGRALLPPAAQAYRLHPPALLLLMIAGAACAPTAWSALSARSPLRRAWVAAAWIGCVAGLATAWPQPSDTTPESVLAEIAPHLPTGSRAVIDDEAGWHRYACDRWRGAGGWQVANAFHLLFAPPTLAGLTPAAASLGIGMQYPSAADRLDDDAALRVLADYGIDRLVRIDAVRQPRSTRREPPAELLIATSGHARIWALPTRPAVEPIVGEVIALDADTGRDERAILADWWTRLRAQRALDHRLVLSGADDPGCAAGFTAADLDDPPRVRLHATGASFAVDTWLERVGRAWTTALRPVAERIAALAVTAKPAIAPGTCTWSADGRVATIGGLVPGRAYLWRTASSPRFAAHGARLHEEVGGLTVLVASAEVAVVSVTQPRLALLGMVINAVALAAAVGLLIRGRR